MIVLDTSVLLYWVAGTDRLSPAAAAAIAGSDQIIVSSISLWEIGWKMKQGKLELPVSVREFAIRLAGVQKVEIVAVDTETWLRNVALEWEHRDPADRTIVATAELRGCPLLTSDARILAFYRAAAW